MRGGGGGRRGEERDKGNGADQRELTMTTAYTRNILAPSPRVGSRIAIFVAASPLSCHAACLPMIHDPNPLRQPFRGLHYSTLPPPLRIPEAGYLQQHNNNDLRRIFLIYFCLIFGCVQVPSKIAAKSYSAQPISA